MDGDAGEDSEDGEEDEGRQVQEDCHPEDEAWVQSRHEICLVNKRHSTQHVAGRFWGKLVSTPSVCNCALPRRRCHSYCVLVQKRSRYGRKSRIGDNGPRTVRSVAAAEVLFSGKRFSIASRELARNLGPRRRESELSRCFGGGKLRYSGSHRSRADGWIDRYKACQGRGLETFPREQRGEQCNGAYQRGSKFQATPARYNPTQGREGFGDEWC